MANQRTEFPVEKPYLKVDRSIKSRHSSSSGNVNLSYSYSCVREFEENQYIIGELAAIHNKARYRGLSHEPTLFTLTGDREKPVCQPFYYSTLSEHNRSSNNLHNTNKSSTDESQQLTNSVNEPIFTGPRYNLNRSCREDFVREYHCESEPEFPDLQVLVQWLKYQFKYINYFWPFSKTNCKFITNLCKRNRKMKMEMLLNNLNEDTKSKLKQCVADMNLNMEEKFSLCNESIIEIDISPIVECPERLQYFLVFLRSIELGNSTEIDKVKSIKKNVETKTLNENQTEVKKGIIPKQVIEHTSLFKNSNVSDNLCNNIRIKSNNNQPNNIFNQVDSKNDRERLIEKCCKPLFNGEFQSGTCKNDCKSYNNKLIGNNENEIGDYTFNIEDSATQNQSRYLQNKLLINENQLQSQLRDKKIRMNSTFADKHLKIENKTNTLNPTNVININNQSVCHTNRVLIDHLRENQTLLPKRNWSCKCLIHENREDYIRYKNQCLLGKGDEKSNGFLKYVINNNKCETCVDDYQRVSGHTKKQVFDMESVNDDYPSVTKLVSNDQEKTETETKPKINNLKYTTNKAIINKCLAKNKLSSSSRSSKHERVNNKKLQTKSLSSPSQNSSGIDFRYNGRNSILDNKNNFVEPYKCCEEDVEKLVCAVNLSKHSITSDCFKSVMVNSNNNLYVKQDAINACFESLDFSVNSFSINIEEKPTLKLPIPNSSSKKSTNVSTKLPHGSNNPSVSSTYLTENYNVANTFEVNRIRKSELGSYGHDKEKNNYGFEITPYKYYDEHSITEPNDYNTSVSVNGKNKSKQIKVSQNQVHVLIKSANEVEKDITLLNERISQLNTRQEKMYISDKSEPRKQKKRSFLIRINSGDTQEISEPSQASIIKKHLNLNPLKPRNIYRSISSIFKGNRTKYKGGSGSMNNKTSSIECYKGLSKDNSYRTEIAFNNSGFKESLTPQSSNVVEDNSQLLLRCLEKLYEQLERQQNEIQEMKRVLHNYTK